jgi:hypothetical protein
VTRRDQEKRAAGYVPVDVAGYWQGGERRFAVVWRKQANAGEEVRLLAGVPLSRLGSTIEPLKTQTFTPHTYHYFLDPSGNPLVSMIWSRPAAGRGWRYSYGDEGKYELALKPGNKSGDLQVDVTVLRQGQPFRQVPSELLAWLGGSPPWSALYLRSQRPFTDHPERAYAAVWHGSQTLVSRELHGLDPAAHREACRQLAAEGWSLVALSVASVGDDKPLVTASVWHRAGP